MSSHPKSDIEKAGKKDALSKRTPKPLIELLAADLKEDKKHGHLCFMIINHRGYLCKIDPTTGNCDEDNCLPANDHDGAIAALALSGE